MPAPLPAEINLTTYMNFNQIMSPAKAQKGARIQLFLAPFVPLCG
jgi:hypothetical protein